MANLVNDLLSFMRAKRTTQPLLSVLGLLSLLFFPPFVLAGEQAPPFFGTVVEVSKANSLMVKQAGGDITQVTLAFLSIPIGNQPYASRAHQILKAQLLNRRVSVRPIGSPDAAYLVGLVYVGNENFNLDFLRRGHAWVDYFQVSHPSWLTTQQRARAEKRGLYADPEATHPLEWQRQMIKATRVSELAREIAADTTNTAKIRKTFVGHRKDKIYVPFDCIETWATWSQVQRVPLLTVAGAEDSGFRFQACQNPGKQPNAQ